MSEEETRNNARELRRRVTDMEVTKTVHCDFTDLERLTEAIDGFTKAEVDKNGYLMTQNALKIIKSYSELSLQDGIRPSETIFQKYKNLTQIYKQLKEKENELKKEIEREREHRVELFNHNKTLVSIIDRLVTTLEKFGVKVDEGGNPLSH